MAAKILWSSVILLAVAGFWGWQKEADKPIFKASFDRAQWQQNMQSEDGKLDSNGILQTRMAKDLIAKQTLIGKSRAEIEQMLNQPTVFEGETKQSQARQMRYTLRNIYNLISPLRTDELIVKLDDRGKAVSAYIQFRKLSGS